MKTSAHVPARLVLALLCAAGFASGCVAPAASDAPDFTPSSSRMIEPNTAPRGSEAFCRTYGQQTSTNRALDSGPDGRGSTGFDRTLAASEGERAYRRCLTGRTN